MAIIIGQPTEESDRILADGENDIIDGLGGGDIIIGGEGDDTLIGGLGNDQLQGEGGNDQLLGGSGSDILDGGEGTDQITEIGDLDFTLLNTQLFSRISGSLLLKTIEQLISIEHVTLVGGNSANVLDASAFSQGIVALNGQAGNDTLIGGSQDDRLIGGDDDDTLDGGAGRDKLSGGFGNDIYVVTDTGDAVLENLNEGIDTVQSNVSFTLGANVENLTLTSGATGRGNELSNIITGSSGSDRLDGGQSGSDTLRGGLGNDTYVIDGDVVADRVITITEAFNAGEDIIRSNRDFILVDHIEHLTLTGSNNIFGFGNSLDNVITGNIGDNTLSGQGGNDTLSGGSGNDFLDGGTGNDTFDGGSGFDTIFAFEDGNMILNQNTLITSSGTKHFVGIEAAQLRGRGGDNFITAASFSGSVTINGQGGNDTLSGGQVNDQLFGDTGKDTLNGGAGSDILNGFGGGSLEFDILTGGADADIFVLGDASRVFYAQSGLARITDFSTAEGDKIQLNGSLDQYKITFVGGDTFIERLPTGVIAVPIAVVKGVAVNISAFTFV